MAVSKWRVVFRFRWRDWHVTDYRIPIILVQKRSRALSRLIGLRSTCYTRKAGLVSSPKIPFVVNFIIEHTCTHNTFHDCRTIHAYSNVSGMQLPRITFLFRPCSRIALSVCSVFLCIYFCLAGRQYRYCLIL